MSRITGKDIYYLFKSILQNCETFESKAIKDFYNVSDDDSVYESYKKVNLDSVFLRFSLVNFNVLEKLRREDPSVSHGQHLYAKKNELTAEYKKLYNQKSKQIRPNQMNKQSAIVWYNAVIKECKTQF